MLRRAPTRRVPYTSGVHSWFPNQCSDRFARETRNFNNTIKDLIDPILGIGD